VWWELLVVENNCADSTCEVVEEFEGALPIRLLHQPKQGKSHALNLSLAEARGDYILWTDDDVVVEPGWLASFTRAAERHPEAAAIGGRIVPWFPVPPDPLLCEVFPMVAKGFCALDYGSEERILEDDEYVWGANLGVKAAEVRDMRFDPTLGPSPGSMVYGEEVEYLRRLRRSGGVVLWCPSMCVRHYVDPGRMSLRYLLRFEAGKAEEAVRLHGAAGGRSSGLQGIPRWLFRQCIEASAAYVYWLIRGDRRRALEALAVHYRCRGWIRGHRRLRATAAGDAE
jgi:glycosyltransferase involved in cell wall biosynthesis